MKQLLIIILFCLNLVISIRPEYDNKNVTTNGTRSSLNDILKKINGDKNKLNYTIESMEFNKTLNSIGTRSTTNITRGLLGLSGNNYDTVSNSTSFDMNNQTNSSRLPTKKELLIS
ncbi:hypothetical protein FG379_000686 [Cryptosporidium bovis]|uniref:uncharacterized protein n=1 Tax=Cryptosporidium bovis TaxID=310047 RepID=UPI00351AA3B9|nr:hypothetical protein FG379_000686 [Cryptosporidium bovis]